MKAVQLIFIGERFYSESDTVMSPIYEHTENAYIRWHWGMVSSHLSNGGKIKIRPATPKELKYFEEQLKDIKEKINI